MVDFLHYLATAVRTRTLLHHQNHHQIHIHSTLHLLHSPADPSMAPANCVVGLKLLPKSINVNAAVAAAFERDFVVPLCRVARHQFPEWTLVRLTAAPAPRDSLVGGGGLLTELPEILPSTITCSSSSGDPIDCCTTMTRTTLLSGTHLLVVGGG